MGKKKQFGGQIFSESLIWFLFFTHVVSISSLMPQPSEAAAFLAFTGDTHFNLDCRKRAKRRGMHLNEFGLWRSKLDDRMLKQPGVNEVDLDNINGQGSYPNTVQEYQTQWELVETPDEAALLQELDMGYIVPERRNLANLNTKEKVKRGDSTQTRHSKRDQLSPPQLARNHAPPDSNSPPRRHQLSQLQNPPNRPLQRSQKHVPWHSRSRLGESYSP